MLKARNKKIELTELEGPYECAGCQGHFMVDATYLDQVKDIINCPYCKQQLKIPEDRTPVKIYELKKQTFTIEWGVDGQFTQDYEYNTEEEANAFFKALLESDGWIDFKVTKEPEIWDISKQLIKDLKQEDKKHEENTRINND